MKHLLLRKKALNVGRDVLTRKGADAAIGAAPVIKYISGVVADQKSDTVSKCRLRSAILKSGKDKHARGIVFEIRDTISSWRASRIGGCVSESPLRLVVNGRTRVRGGDDAPGSGVHGVSRNGERRSVDLDRPL